MRISKPYPAMLVCAVATFSPLPVASQILPPGASVERLASGFQFTEGPAYDGHGNLFFTDVNGRQIIRYEESTGTTEVADADSGRANGLFFDQNGQLVSMDMGDDRRQVSRRATDEISMVAEVLATEWNGSRFNSTNDLVIDQDGGIYFTDPDYLNRQSLPDAVYYLNPSGELAQIITGFNRPNGIILSPDGQTLYLAVEKELRIMAYDVGADGLPSNEREFARTDVDDNGDVIRGITSGPDGLTVDPAGNVYAAVQSGVWAWDPTGERLFDLSVPERPSNVTFGGADGKTLFITARSSLYGIELDIAPLSGDLNGDGAINLADLTPFALGLTDVPAYESMYPDVDRVAAGDINTDGNFNFGDLTPFVELLTAGGAAHKSAVPEPSAFAVLLAGAVGLGVLRRRM